MDYITKNNLIIALESNSASQKLAAYAKLLASKSEDKKEDKNA